MSMPLYLYQCQRCGQSFEELQGLHDGTPATVSECPQKSSQCPLERQLTTAGHRFTNDLSSDGRGGYERQGDAMIRQIPGKNSASYGTDRSGRS